MTNGKKKGVENLNGTKKYEMERHVPKGMI